jgi:transcriptional/translational regulatory protein YebC/TACO1
MVQAIDILCSILICAGGGVDPGLNPRLATAIANAKRAGFSKSSIEGAVARGQGRSASGATLESVTIEAVSPPAALMIDIETDSKARVLQDLRVILKKYGAREGAAAYLFEKRGRSMFTPRDGVGVDEVFETAVEAGALDVEEGEEGRIVVDTEIEGTQTAEKRIVEEMKLELDSSDTVWHPTEQVEEADQSVCATLSKLQEELEDYDDVRAVYSNVLLVEDVAEQAAMPA